MALVYGNAYFRIVRNQILKFIGLSPVWTTHLSVMTEARPETLQTMLDQAARDGAADAAKLLSRTARPNPFAPGGKPDE